MVPCDRAGEHLQVRLFFSPPSFSIFSAFRLFEQHPFSISNAPSDIGIITASHPYDSTDEKDSERERDPAGEVGANLYIRSCGPNSWTHDLYSTASLASLVAEASPPTSHELVAVGARRKPLLHLFALVEGPYGGIGPYLEFDQDNVLLVAGGGGMSFILGILDEIVGRRVRNRRGGKIQIIWAVRERGSFSTLLS